MWAKLSLRGRVPYMTFGQSSQQSTINFGPFLSSPWARPCSAESGGGRECNRISCRKPFSKQAKKSFRHGEMWGCRCKISIFWTRQLLGYHGMFWGSSAATTESASHYLESISRINPVPTLIMAKIDKARSSQNSSNQHSMGNRWGTKICIRDVPFLKQL